MKNSTLTPCQAIREKCLECAGRPKEVRLCERMGCPLHAYRFGKIPPGRG